MIYRLSRSVLARLVKPNLVGTTNFEDPDVLYVLPQRSLADLLLLDLACEKTSSPPPLLPLSMPNEARRFFFLNRGAGFFRKNTMRNYSERMLRINRAHTQDPTLRLTVVPVSIYWGRAANKDRSLVRSLVSDQWLISARLRRLLGLVFNRSDILVRFGTSLSWPQGASSHDQGNSNVRKLARILRVHFRNERRAVLGPDLSNRRSLVEEIVASPSVQNAIESADGDWKTLESKARRDAFAIGSNMSYPTIRVLEGLLSWFWHRIYDGVDIQGFERLEQMAHTHTLVYAPCHRSHVDYLVLSHALFGLGLMLPHIAAGDNLNIPVIGKLLRRGGAFFMRRSFRNDPIYRAVIREYLNEVFSRGHSVEYFIEGGRSRTGRMLPPQLGMLGMTLASHALGLPRPVAIVPVYFSYEKLIEANAYLSELRGQSKRRENVADVFRNLRLIKQNFGRVTLRFGVPIDLASFVDNFDPKQHHALPPPTAAESLGHEILSAINDSAHVNPVNLVALTTLSMPRFTIDEGILIRHMDYLKKLITTNSENHNFSATNLSPTQIVQHVEQLGMLQRGEAEDGGLLGHDPATAILMTWYRNNVLHVVAQPAMLACLLVNRRLPIKIDALERLAQTVLPYIEAELSFRSEPYETRRCLLELEKLDLVHSTGDAVTPPRKNAEGRLHLQLLANALMPTLERFYIAIALLNEAGNSVYTRRSLVETASRTARHYSVLYGTNAPEFFDPAPFRGLVRTLEKRGVVGSDKEGYLYFDASITELVRASHHIIKPELQHSIPSSPLTGRDA
ncbi:MAG: glycerol-3-phosphate 1-O-acyltransferase PlsB [Pseudomonadales bacterium]|nr:glycerol-3-phosphate 1-O-acyltransferase PlsB [Pseudomonadales bacterium]